jgi:Ca-activated chloride channel family protein
MKSIFNHLGLILVLGVSSVGGATLNLRLEPDQRLLLAGVDREVVVKVDLESVISQRINRLPLNLAVVLDHSGSMAGAKIEKTKQAAMQLIDQLTPQDNLALVEFDDKVHVIFPAQPVTDREALKARVNRIEPGGSTALYAGVRAGGEQLLHLDSNPDRIKRVILLSDGLANVGPSSTADLKELGRSLSHQSVSVSTIGVGDDYNEDLMAGLAEASDANYYYVQDAEKLPEIFKKELGGLQTITARDVQIDISCPDGVEPIDLIGRPEKFVQRRAKVALGPFASGQNRYLFLRCRVKSPDAKPQTDLATVKVTYRDEKNGSMDTEIAETVQIAFTTNDEEARGSVNPVVASERELQLNALAKDQALADADSGNYESAAKSLEANAARLESIAPSAPAGLKEDLESKAAEQRRRADEISASGLSKPLRKAIQNENYQRKNGKE